MIPTNDNNDNNTHNHKTTTTTTTTTTDDDNNDNNDNIDVAWGFSQSVWSRRTACFREPEVGACVYI